MIASPPGVARLWAGPCDIVAISAGWKHSLAISSTGELWVWGANNSGQLGLGSCNSTTSSPQPVNLGTDFPLSSDAGYKHSLAVLDTGQVRSWGRTVEGQLGNGAITGPDCANESFNTPQIVVELPGFQPLQNIIDASAGQQHSIALSATGIVYSWGFDGEGQLGRDTPSPDPFARRVADVGPQSPEPMPGDQGNVLRAVKLATLDDLELTWTDPGVPVSFGLWSLHRDLNKLLIGTTPLGPVPIVARSFIDSLIVTDYTKPVCFYYLRGRSPCSLQPGP